MKKNILTIIIMAIVLINLVLTAVLIFVIVPASNKTNLLVDKIASVVNLELEDPQKEEDVTVSDIVTYEIEDKQTINLKSTDATPHYATLYVSLSMNSKNKDYGTLSGKIKENENAISEIVQEEFAKYTKDEINTNKSKIKDNVLKRVQELFDSDFILSVTFGKMVIQ